MTIRTLVLLSILCLLPHRAIASEDWRIGKMPDNALNRVGWAFDGHDAAGQGWPADSIGRYDLSALYGDCVQGWYYDFGTDPRGGDDSSLAYAMHMLWGMPDRITIESIIRNNPDDVIVIGNEPDLASQGNMTPEKFAAFYHDAYTLIRSVSPEYRIAIGGVSVVDDKTLSYLADTLAAYQQIAGERMLVDVWTMHAYGETPATLASIQRQVVAMRAFMAANGYQDAELWLTEFNTTPERMAEIYDWLLTAQADSGLASDGNRLVQRFAHFALNSYGGWENYAFDKVTAQPTQYADAFHKWVSGIVCEREFLPVIAG